MLQSCKGARTPQVVERLPGAAGVGAPQLHLLNRRRASGFLHGAITQAQSDSTQNRLTSWLGRSRAEQGGSGTESVGKRGQTFSAVR